MKLYWRVKINGKWTWRPAKLAYLVNDLDEVCCIAPWKEEEE